MATPVRIIVALLLALRFRAGFACTREAFDSNLLSGPLVVATAETTLSDQSFEEQEAENVDYTKVKSTSWIVKTEDVYSVTLTYYLPEPKYPCRIVLKSWFLTRLTETKLLTYSTESKTWEYRGVLGSIDGGTNVVRSFAFSGNESSLISGVQLVMNSTTVSSQPGGLVKWSRWGVREISLTEDIIPATPAPTINLRGESPSGAGAGAVIGASLGATLFLVGAALLYAHRRRSGADSEASSALGIFSGPPKLATSHSISMHAMSSRDASTLVKRNSWIVPWNRLSIGEKVAAGGSGQVYKGTYSSRPVAIKELFSTVIDSDDLNEFETEAGVLASLHHPHIVQFFGVAFHGNGLYLVLEWCPHSLSSLFLPKKEPISLHDALRYATSIAETMSFLHDRGIVHRDLKPANVLLSKDYEIKLCDFGLSKKLETMSNTGKMTMAIGTPGYMAPELLGSGQSDNLDAKKVDVYAFGVMMNALFSSQRPFTNLPAMRVIAAVKLEGLRPEIAEATPNAIAALVKICWAEKPELRPNFPEITNALRSIDI